VRPAERTEAVTARASLDGIWEVQLEPGEAWREIRVPFTFEAPLSGIGASHEVHERVRYRRSFRVPDEWEEERTRLCFGAVDWRARVSLDGRMLGEHEGGYAQFAFDAGRLSGGSEHELVVDVFDPADDAFGQPKGKQRGSGGIWYTRTTGIWQSVWIDASPADDSARPRAAVRRIERRGRRLFLDGDPLRIAGVLDQGFWPDGVYTAPSADTLRADVEAAKALGFNLIRKHVKVEDPRWYAWCDRLGMLVAQDMPSSHDLSTELARERFLQEWLEIVDQLRAHRCIVMWIPFNEHWGEPPPDFQREVVRATRAADPTRLVVDASGWNQLDDTDLVDVHDYGAELKEHRGARADLPVWFGECGGISLPVKGRADFSYRNVTSADELVDGYRALVEQIPDDVAGFVWTQLTDVEGELNGLLTYDRVPKVDPARIREINEAFLQTRGR
jgi:Glycosyl hydrolases family 2, sugar binding domain/Glycosyl hydrolases family 2, TIM barrel domain